MPRVKTHILVSGLSRFSEYAAMCAESLIVRGRVQPMDIIVSKHNAEDSSAWKVLEALGVDIRRYAQGEIRNSKMVYVDKYLREEGGPDLLVQLDSDCLLTQDCDFHKLCATQLFHPARHMWGYQQDYGSAEESFRLRNGMLHQDFRPLSEDFLSRDRYDYMIQAGFGVTREQFEGFMRETKHWVFGGMSVISRSILDRPVWKGFQLMARLSPCDESAIMLARCADPTIWGAIPQSPFPHVVNPKTLSLDDAPGILHYAGDWYRWKNEAHRAMLSARYKALEERLLKP